MFSSGLKEGNDTAVFKKLVLIGLFYDPFLSKFPCAVWEGFNTQQALQCKSSLDKKGSAGAVLIDLSKAPHSKARSKAAKGDSSFST